LRRPRTQRVGEEVKGSLAFIALVALFIVVGLAVVHWRSPKEHRFVVAAWLAEETTRPGPCLSNRRADMADDLIEHHLKRGMTPTRVHRLLGKPYAYKQYGTVRGEWWPTGFEGNDCTVLSVWYRGGHLTDAAQN
jgi:hypothetical protein